MNLSFDCFDVLFAGKDEGVGKGEMRFHTIGSERT